MIPKTVHTHSEASWEGNAKYTISMEKQNIIKKTYGYHQYYLIIIIDLYRNINEISFSQVFFMDAQSFDEW